METTKTFEQEGAVLLAQSDGCSVWQFRNDTGDGAMTTYDVCPGVMLCFNDFHMEYYNSSFVPDRRILAIDHCREGRMEYSAGKGMWAIRPPRSSSVRTVCTNALLKFVRRPRAGVSCPNNLTHIKGQGRNCIYAKPSLAFYIFYHYERNWY